jgi:hypothetical protein
MNIKGSLTLFEISFRVINTNAEKFLLMFKKIHI